MYQDESASRSTPISGRPWRWRSSTAGCGSVTMYWCSTGMTGMSSPTIAPVCRAKLPVAETTCSQTMSPLSVLTATRRRRALDAGDGRLAVDLGAARAGALGEGLGQVGGLDVAVVRVLDRAEDAVDLAERPDLLDLLRRQHVDLDADRLARRRRSTCTRPSGPCVRARRMFETCRKPTFCPVSASRVL